MLCLLSMPWRGVPFFSENTLRITPIALNGIKLGCSIVVVAVVVSDADDNDDNDDNDDADSDGSDDSDVILCFFEEPT